MTPIDQAYFWSINPQTAQKSGGLSSLAPTFGFNSAPKPTQLNPQALFPDAPGYSSQVTDYNSHMQELVGQQLGAINGYGYNHNGGQSRDELEATLSEIGGRMASLPGPFAWARNGQSNTPATVNAPDLNPTAKPYFDPYYPNESMLALKNYLAPQVESQLNSSMNARGLNYSGVGAYNKQEAQSALAQLAPQGQTSQDAFVADLQRNFGALPAQSIAKAQVPGATTPPDFTGGSERLVMNTAKQNDPAAQSPLYSIASGAGTYASPGYFYNPNQAPDVSQMPWLNPGTTQPTQPTQPKSNVKYLG